MHGGARGCGLEQYRPLQLGEAVNGDHRLFRKSTFLEQKSRGLIQEAKGSFRHREGGVGGWKGSRLPYPDRCRGRGNGFDGCEWVACM